MHTSHSIHLVHKRSHTNNYGNDLADQLANTARHSGTPLTLLRTKYYIEKLLKTQQYHVWNSDWQTNCTASPLFKWVPSIFMIPKYFPTNYYQTQIFTGHGRFPYYFLKFQITNNRNCFCGQPADSFMHYTSTCPLTQTFHTQLTKLLPQGLNDHNKPNVAAKIEIMTILEPLTAHIL